jgi:biopolymer transport protein ExbB/TolQ
MDIQIIITILISVSVLLNIILINRGMKLVRIIESLQDRSYNERIAVQSSLNTMLDEMREIDIRGSFESDDEVGAVFTELKQLVERYNELVE